MKRQPGMNRVKRGVLDQSHDRVLDGQVIDVVRDRCSVRLSGNGQVLRGLRYSGGPLSAGDRCLVSYQSGRPVVQAMGRSAGSTAARNPARAKLVVADITRSQLGGAGGGYVPNHTHTEIELHSASGVLFFSPDAAGLAGAGAAQQSGDTILIPATTDITFTSLTLLPNVTLAGANRFTSILRGQVIGDDGCELNSLTLILMGSQPTRLTAVKMVGDTGLIANNVHVRAINAAGPASCIEVDGGAEAWVSAGSSYLRANAPAGQAADVFYAASPCLGANAEFSTLANADDLSEAPDGSWSAASGLDLHVYKVFWHDGYQPGPNVFYRAGDRSATAIWGRPVSDAVPADGQGMVYNDTAAQWEPTTLSIPWSGVTGKPNHQALFMIQSAVATNTGSLRLYNHFGEAKTISAVYLDIATAPTGAALIADLHKGGTTIFTNQAHRPQIAAGANQGSTTTIDVATWNDGEYLTLDIDQVGSTVAGAWLTVTIVFA